MTHDEAIKAITRSAQDAEHDIDVCEIATRSAARFVGSQQPLMQAAYMGDGRTYKRELSKRIKRYRKAIRDAAAEPYRASLGAWWSVAKLSLLVVPQPYKSIIQAILAVVELIVERMESHEFTAAFGGGV